MSEIDTRTVTLKGGEGCAIRTAEAVDAAGLLSLIRASLAGPYLISTPEEFVCSAAEEVCWIERHRAQDGYVAIVAVANDEVIGTISFRNGERTKLAHRGAFGLTVDPHWQRRGVGSALLDALLEWARSHPEIQKVGLAVQADNTGAIALYERHGFVEEGRRVREIRLGPEDYRDDILMYRLV